MEDARRFQRKASIFYPTYDSREGQYERRSSQTSDREYSASRSPKNATNIFYLGPNNQVVAQLSHRNHSLPFTISYFWSVELLNQSIFWNYSLGLIAAGEWLRLPSVASNKVKELLSLIPIRIITFDRITSEQVSKMLMNSYSSAVKVLDASKINMNHIIEPINASERAKLARGA